MSKKIMLDIQMCGLEDGMPRIYTEYAPTILARIYKDPPEFWR